MTKKKQVKIDRIGVVAALDNGVVHQVLITKETENAILSLIQEMEDGVKVDSEPITSISLEFEL